MTVAKLLGFDLCPRLRDLAERRLYLPRAVDLPENLERIAITNVSEPAITKGWDELLRLIASIRSGRVSPKVALERLGSVASLGDVALLKDAVKMVRISEELKRYIVDLAAATRKAPGVQLGASPRASLALMKTAQALALFDGSPFVTPDHIQEIAGAVLAHRLALDPQARFSGVTAEGIVADLLKTIPVPA